MTYVFGIPSYQRADSITTVKLLKDYGYSSDRIIVSTQTEDDYNRYRDALKNSARIIYKEGNCVSDNRNNILDSLTRGSKLVMLDDDLKAICRLSQDGKKMIPFSGEEIDAFIKKAFDYIKRRRALVWTGYPVENAYFMSHTVTDKTFGVACIMGIVVSEYRFNPEYTIKEDYDFCLQTIKNGLNCVRFNYIHALGRHKTKGGCSDFWSTDDACTKRLLLNYSRYIRAGAKNNSVLMRKEWTR